MLAHSLHFPLAMNTRLLATSAVWMEGEALVQLERAASLPGCVHAVGLPDLHPGPGGLPIGVALAFEDSIYPGLIGADAGCGVRAVVTTLRRPSLDYLERRLRAAMDEDMHWGDPCRLIDLLLVAGIRGLAEFDDLPSSLRLLAALEQPQQPLRKEKISSDLLADHHAESLGTIGAGNHFAEVSCITEAINDESGIARGRLTILVHSGSRGVGYTMAERFGKERIRAGDASAFLAAQAWACRFAEANRWLIAWRLLTAVAAARPDKLSLSLDCVHNQVVPKELDGRTLWLHRKGAAPAELGRLTVVLGSRGTPSRIMRGTGSATGLESVAHGAGRRLTRAAALAKLRVKYSRASLARTELKSRVLCDRNEPLYEEHPDAYKPIQPVVDSIVASGLATPIATLTPLITVKK